MDLGGSGGELVTDLRGQRPRAPSKAPGWDDLVPVWEAVCPGVLG
jgi:hypothetical protein